MNLQASQPPISTVGLHQLSRKIAPCDRFSGLVRGCLQGFRAFRQFDCSSGPYFLTLMAALALHFPHAKDWTRAGIASETS